MRTHNRNRISTERSVSWFSSKTAGRYPDAHCKLRRNGGHSLDRLLSRSAKSPELGAKANLRFPGSGSTRVTTAGNFTPRTA